MSKLVDYLNLLDKDAAACKTHNADPKAAMTAFGLSDAEQQTFMSGDKTAVANMAGIKPIDFPKLNVSNFDTIY